MTIPTSLPGLHRMDEAEPMVRFASDYAMQIVPQTFQDAGRVAAASMATKAALPPSLGPSLSANISRADAIDDLDVEIRIHGNDVSVRTELPQTAAARARRKPGGKRGKITGFSKQSRRNLRVAVRNVFDAHSFITVTVPPGRIVDGATLRRWWDRLREWLIHGRVPTKGGETRSLNASGVLVKEFTKHGVPHLHIVVDVPIKQDWLSREWSRITGCFDPAFVRSSVRIDGVRNLPRLASYMAKLDQKVAPEGYELGRWWSAFGVKKPRPIVVIRAKRRDLLQFLVYLWHQRPRALPPRTADGLPPMRFWVRGGVDRLWTIWAALGAVDI